MRAIFFAVLACLASSHELRDNDSLGTESEVCLLSLRANMSRAAAEWSHSGEIVAQTHRKMQEWAENHATIKNELLAAKQQVARKISEDTNEIDQFIKDQKNSEDTCYAKLLEARRTLDGITEKVLRLSEEVEAQEEISQGNMIIIKDRFSDSEDAMKEKDDSNRDCEEKFEQGIEDLSHFDDELMELKQIANPEVRSKVAEDLDYKQLIAQHVAGLGAAFDEQQSQAESFLLQMNATACQGVVNYLNRRAEQKAKILGHEENSTKYTALDCTATRDVLQDEFTKSWEEITRLKQEGQNLAAERKDVCFDEAKEVHNTKMAAITQDIKDATRSIQMAKDVMSALEPLLENARLEAERLALHIKSLKEDCKSDMDVSAHLQKVRSLIESLDECPGRNDFKLTVPELPSF